LKAHKRGPDSKMWHLQHNSSTRMLSNTLPHGSRTGCSYRESIDRPVAEEETVVSEFPYLK
jgi:hypothetical protein